MSMTARRPLSRVNLPERFTQAGAHFCGDGVDWRRVDDDERQLGLALHAHTF